MPEFTNDCLLCSIGQPRRRRLFPRPPLAHKVDPIECEHYTTAYKGFLIVFRTFTSPMLNAAADAARDVRHEREVGG